MGWLAGLFGGRISQYEFERCVFSFVTKRVTDKGAVKVTFEAIGGLPFIVGAGAEERREKAAAHAYLALEEHIANGQTEKRIPKEVLREQVYRHCGPERTDGAFPLLFLSKYDREVQLAERYASALIARSKGLYGGEGYRAFLKSLEDDARLPRLVKKDAVTWMALEKAVRRFGAAERVRAIEEVIKEVMAVLARRLTAAVDTVRTELFFRETYREFRDKYDFLDDVPRMLFVVPDEFLREERTELLGKTELQHELRRKSDELEMTLERLKEEEGKIKTLTREELERAVGERTAELRKALEDVERGRAKLEEANAKDEAFLEGIAEGLVAVDEKGNVLLWNKAAGIISGWAKHETLGHPFRKFLKFVREKDRAEDYGFVEEALSSGEVTRVEHNLLVTRGGSEIAVSMSASPILSERKKPSSVIVIFRDITKERELENTRQEFASLATHELRSPVGAVKGYATLLLDGSIGKLTAEQKHIAEQIKKSNDRLLELINAMLNASRLELGTIAIDPEPVYLPDVVDRVVNELAGQIVEKGIELEREYDRKLPIVDVDPRLMQAIVQNLVTNAIKYTPEKGAIRVAVEKKDADALISVMDTGYGIPEKDQGKIFTKLFRADNVRVIHTEGTGLGLYIVKSVVEQAGGRIWFESPAPVVASHHGKKKDEHPGSAFYVTIPLAGMKRKEGLKGLS